jgi:hypothetical protein
LYTYVANDCSKCLISFFKRTLKMCLSGCCICFAHMLQVCLSGYCICSAIVFKYFCNYFRCMFQVFHLVFIRILQMFRLDVSKTDRMLLLETHLPQPPTTAAGVPPSRRRCPGRGNRGGASVLRAGSGGVNDVRMARAPMWARGTEGQRRPSASTVVILLAISRNLI